VRLAVLTAALALLMTGALIYSRHSLADSAVFDSCCICIYDVLDEKLDLSTCKRWLGETARKTSCQYQRIVPEEKADDFKAVAGGDRCRSLHLYGAFHATSADTEIPFKYSANAAAAFQARSVCYDGASCLVFDNIEDVRACARAFKKSPGCRYEITGNQNLGRLWWFAPFCRPHEPVESTSKLTAIIDGVSVRLQYSACTPKGATCGYLPRSNTYAYAASKNDPNAKWCEDEGVLVEQHCCPRSRKPDEKWGRWSAPGEKC